MYIYFPEFWYWGLKIIRVFYICLNVLKFDITIQITNVHLFYNLCFESRESIVNLLRFPVEQL